MKMRSRRLMALLLSAAMVFPAQASAYAGETTETAAAAAVAETQAVTEAPQPQTQPPTEAPQPQTQAVTEAPQPQTQAPTEAPQPQTQAPTEAPQPQTQAPTEAPQPQTQAPTEAPQPQTQAPTEAQTQAQNQTETEKTTGSLKAKADGVEAVIQLPKSKELPASTRAVLKTADGKDQKKLTARAEEVLEKEQKTLSGIRTLTVSLTDKDGSAVKIPKGTRIGFSFGSGLDLGLRDRGQGEYHFLTVDDGAEEAGADLAESADGKKLTSASVSLKQRADGSVTFAAAAVQNRENTGDALDKDQIGDFSGASAYAVVAGNFEGSGSAMILEKDDKDEEKSGQAGDLLDRLGKWSLQLADAKDCDAVRVVNLYADSEGKVSADYKTATDPMYGILSADGSIDVTDRYVVVNVVAEKADADLEMPRFAVTYTRDGKTEEVNGKKNRDQAGRLIVNVVAGNGQSGDGYGFVPYTGSISFGDKTVGTILAPAAELHFDDKLIGAAYGDKVTVDGKLVASTVTGEGKKEEKNTEKSEETDVAEKASEKTGKTESETAEQTEKTGAGVNGTSGTPEKAQEPALETEKEEQSDLQPESGLAGAAAKDALTESDETDAGQTDVIPPASGADALSTENGMTESSSESELSSESSDLGADNAVEAETTAQDTPSETAELYTGTVNVSILKKTAGADKAETTEALAGVVLSLYEKAEDGQADRMAATFTSDQGTVPSGVLEKGKTYILREEAMPAPTENKTTAEDGTESTTYTWYAKAPEFTFTVSEDGKTLTVTSDAKSGWTLEAAAEAADTWTISCTHEAQVSSQKQQANTVTIAVQDGLSQPVAGSEIVVSSVTGTGESQTVTAQSIFNMPAGSVAYDFTKLLKEALPAPDADEASPAPDAGETEEGAAKVDQPVTAVFRIEEKRPADGMASLSQSAYDLTFTYQKSETEGSAGSQESETAGAAGSWTLTGGTPEGTPEVTFTDAYVVAIDSQLVNYADLSGNTVLKANLQGAAAAVAVKNSDADAAAASYRLCTETKYEDRTVYTLGDAPASTAPVTMGESTVYLALQGAGKGSTVTAAGTWGQNADYHFISKGDSATAVLGAEKTAAGAPVLTLKSRRAARVEISSLMDDGKTPLVGDDIKVKVAGYEQAVKLNPTVFVLNSADADEAVSAMLGKTGPTDYVVGSANRDKYIFSPAVGNVTAASEDAEGNAAIAASVTSTQSYVNGKVVVRKQLLRQSNNRKLSTSVARNYYFGIFADAAGNEMVDGTEIRKVTVSRYNSISASTASAAFTVPVDSRNGATYYLFETNDKGQPVQDNNDFSMQVSQDGTVSKGNGAAVSFQVANLSGGSSSAIQKTAVVQNLYSDSYIADADNGFMSSGEFGIELRVVDAEGKELPVDNLTATFKVKGKDNSLSLKNNPSITLNKASSGKKEGITFPLFGQTGTMSVTLLSIKNSKGESLAKQFTLLTASYDNRFSKVGTKTGERTFTLQADKQNQGPVVFVLRQNETNEKASLTLSKAVMYKKTPVRVNATYYIGIFSDAAHKKLLFKKAMTLKDASSMSDTLKVNINSQKNRTITLYFAETDRNGKVVESGKKTGYDISLSKTQVTLSPTNMEDSVVVTNEVRDGSKAAERLTDPDSGFAGDSAALADAQSLAASSNLGTKTGDSTPFRPYLIVVLISAAVIAGLWLILRRRRKA